MPNRIIRSGFLDSEKINSLSEKEQLFFIRLMLVADDYGCFDARPQMIRSACYPVSDMRLSDVSKLLLACCNVGLLSIYEELGKKYLVIHNFDQRLRQRRRKYPKPKDLQELSDNCQTVDGQLHATMPESESESESEEKRREEKRSRVRPDHPTPIENRLQEFKGNVFANKGQFPEKMLSAFFGYWSEKNRSGTKARFELEKTWELSKRLATWANKDKEFSKPNSKPESAQPFYNAL